MHIAHKFIIVGQIIFVATVFSMALLFAPRLEYPLNKEVFTNPEVEFSYINAHVILIDTNEDFTSPRSISLEETNISKISFEPGTYYWKAVGVVESLPREFTVESTVGLEIDQEKNTLVNVGDTKLNVSITDNEGSSIGGLVILDVNVEYPIDSEKEVNYQGEQHG